MTSHWEGELSGAQPLIRSFDIIFYSFSRFHSIKINDYISGHRRGAFI